MSLGNSAELKGNNCRSATSPRLMATAQHKGQFPAGPSNNPSSKPSVRDRFAWDPLGNGKMASVRAGIYYDIGTSAHSVSTLLLPAALDFFSTVNNSTRLLAAMKAAGTAGIPDPASDRYGSPLEPFHPNGVFPLERSGFTAEHSYHWPSPRLSVELDHEHELPAARVSLLCGKRLGQSTYSLQGRKPTSILGFVNGLRYYCPRQTTHCPHY